MNEKPMKKRKNIIEFFRDNFQKIILILICVIYVVQGLFKFQKTEATLVEIIGNIALSIFVGLTISLNLRSMGLKSGRNSDVFVASVQTYGEVKDKATPMFDKLPSWCEYKNAQELEFKKKEIIQGAGLNWRGYKLGYYESNNDKMNDVQKKAYDEAKNCRIFKFYSNELLSDLPRIDLRTQSRFGKTEKDFKKEENLTDFVVKVGIGIICGLYTLTPLINGDNSQEIIAGIIWHAIQIILWFSIGILKFADARSFIIDEYRHTHIIQKTELLNEFIVTMQNSPHVIEEYDEDLEIDEFIEEFLQRRENKNFTEVIENFIGQEEVRLNYHEQKTILD